MAAARPLEAKLVDFFDRFDDLVDSFSSGRLGEVLAFEELLELFDPSSVLDCAALFDEDPELVDCKTEFVISLTRSCTKTSVDEPGALLLLPEGPVTAIDDGPDESTTSRLSTFITEDIF